MMLCKYRCVHGRVALRPSVNFNFQNCLGLLYTVYIDNMQIQLETLVGNILGCVQVPPPGNFIP